MGIENFFSSLMSSQIELGAQLLNYGITFVIIAAAFLALGFSLWHLNALRDDSEFTVTRESIGEQSEKIRALLTSMKATKREITYALLLIEEIVVRLHDNAQQAVTARIRNFFGDVSISLSSRGEEYNPFASLENWNTESEDYLRDLIFRSHEADLSYTRRNGRNVVVIRAHRAENRGKYTTFIAMVLGVVVGLGMRLLPSEAATFISGNILSTVQNLFLNAISLMLAPCVFFSVATSLSNISGKSEAGRIGGKVVGTYMITTVFAILIGFVLSALFFNGNLPALPESFAVLPENITPSETVSLKSLIFSIIPRNMLSPVIDENMLQIIFVSVLSGLTVSALGDKAAGIKNLFDEANAFFLKMMEFIIRFMPVVAFASLANLLFSCKAALLLVLLKFFLVFICGGTLLFLLYILIILIFGKISPLHYIRKTIVYLLTPFTVPSSCACIPLTIDFCKKKLGVSLKISSFSIPLGATINMNGAAMVCTLTTLFLAHLCGVELDIATCLKLSVIIFMMSVGAPGIPNSGIVIISTLLVAAEIPVSALGFVVGIWNIIDRFSTAFNVNGDIATSVVVAKTEKELDMSVYSA